MLVALGGKCLAGLANGLRKKFAPYAVSVSAPERRKGLFPPLSPFLILFFSLRIFFGTKL